jgi:hypothetical protein
VITQCTEPNEKRLEELEALETAIFGPLDLNAADAALVVKTSAAQSNKESNTDSLTEDLTQTSTGSDGSVGDDDDPQPSDKFPDPTLVMSDESQLNSDTRLPHGINRESNFVKKNMTVISDTLVEETVSKMFKEWVTEMSKSFAEVEKLKEQKDSIWVTKTHPFYNGLKIDFNAAQYLGNEIEKVQSSFHNALQDAYTAKLEEARDTIRNEVWLKTNWKSFTLAHSARINGNRYFYELINQLEKESLTNEVAKVYQNYRAKCYTKPKTQGKPSSDHTGSSSSDHKKRTREKSTDTGRTVDPHHKRQKVINLDTSLPNFHPSVLSKDYPSGPPKDYPSGPSEDYSTQQHELSVSRDDLWDKKSTEVVFQREYKQMFYTIGVKKSLIPDEILILLEKGIKYVPNSQISMEDFNKDLQQIEADMKSVVCRQYNIHKASTTKLDRLFDLSRQKMQPKLLSMIEDHNLSYKFNPKILTEFLSSNNILIKATDKNLGLALIDTHVYAELIEMHLNDRETYQLVDQFDPKLVIAEGHKIRGEAHAAKVLFDMPTPMNNFQLGECYGLPKIHKSGPLKCRLIIPGFRAITAPIAKWLNQKLKGIRNHYPWVLQSTTDLLNSLENQQFYTFKVNLFSFDVESMYTNIEPHDCLLRLNKLLIEHLCPNEHGFIMKTLAWILKHNYFYYKERIFHQCRGVAMGQIIAPLVADLYMVSFEKEWMKLPNFPEYYKRFLDDLLGLTTQPKAEILKLFEHLNSSSKHLKFTMCLSSDKIQFLDVEIFKGKKFLSTLKFDTKLFFKPTNNFLYSTPDSFVPNKRKFGWITGEQVRLIRNNSDITLYQQQMNQFLSHLTNRGYRPVQFKTFFRYEYSDRSYLLAQIRKHRHEDEYRSIINIKNNSHRNIIVSAVKDHLEFLKIEGFPVEMMKLIIRRGQTLLDISNWKPPRPSTNFQ